jgi:beta-N-acetylhexosaminidase
MGTMDGTTPGSRLLGRIRRGELGGVIIFGGNVTSAAALQAAVARLQDAAHAGGNPPLLIAVDQEGGEVKRLPQDPPAASAATMGATYTPAAVRAQGRLTGDALATLGIDVDLAPVVDVGDSRTSFLGSRIFSADPATTASLGRAFATGLQAAGVAATAKHFPGLGTAPGNTDVAVVVVPTPRGELMRRLASFAAAVDGGVKLVMVSSAEYPALDASRRPAALSKTIVTGLLRRRLGFGGVVITDAMNAPAILRYRDAPVLALEAGDDVLLYAGDEDSSARGFTAVLQAARANELSTAMLVRAYDRVVALKAWLR